MRKLLIFILLTTVSFMSSPSANATAKKFKNCTELNKVYPGQAASPESAGAYCASMAEDGGKEYGWTTAEIFQASDSCGIWFTTEMFRK